MKHFLREVIALNKFPYADKVNLLGRNAAISTSVETVWGLGGAYAQLLAGAAMEVVSSSASDTAAGTGARTVQVNYLDANYLPGSEIISLNGITPVPLVKTSVIAINGFKVLTAGSGGTPAGNIDVRVISGAVVKSSIRNAANIRGRAYDFIYTIPAGYVGLLSSINIASTLNTGDLTTYLNLANSSGLEITEGVGKSSLNVTGFNNARTKIDLGTGLLVPEKTKLQLDCYTSAGAGDLTAQAELLLFEVKTCGLF